MTISTNTPLRGIIPPMVTPLLDDETIDHAGLERLIEHLLTGGVHGLFILGTTGEGPSLSHTLRCRLIQAVVTQVAGRVPVLVGITDTSFIESVELADFAADAGAQAVVASTPYYFATAQPELLEYLEQLVKAISLPLLLYNMPHLTKVSFELETVRQALQWENVIGIKDSSGDMKYFNQLLQLTAERPDWSLLVGPEELLAEAVLAGAHGGVSGGANVFPRLYVELYEAATRGDIQQVKALHADVMQISRLLYSVGQHDSSIIKGVKCALAWLGICHDHMALPFRRFQDEERMTVRERLEQLAQMETTSIRGQLEGHAIFN